MTIRRAVDADQMESLTNKLLLKNHPNQKFSNEGIALSNELLTWLVMEAFNRAAVEAECEKDSSTFFSQDSVQDEELSDPKTGTKLVIESKHIQSIAAELLLDFS